MGSQGLLFHLTRSSILESVHVWSFLDGLEGAEKVLKVIYKDFFLDIDICLTLEEHLKGSKEPLIGLSYVQVI